MILYALDIRWASPLFEQTRLHQTEFSLLRLAEHRNVDDDSKLEKNLKQIQQDLQGDDDILSDIRDNVSEVVKEFLSIQHRLKPNARIVHNPLSDDVVIQI